MARPLATPVQLAGLDLELSSDRLMATAVATLENAVATRDEWLRLAAESSELGLWYWNEKTNELFWDSKTRSIFGIDADQEVTLDVFYAALHPDDRIRVEQVWRHEFLTGNPYELEYRTLRKDASVRWVTARGRGHYGENGEPWYMVGVHLDVTERKDAESERLALTGRVMAAQEGERTRIAREIHDDYCQRLALSTMKLDSVARVAGRRKEQSGLIEELRQEIKELITDIQGMSHRLHPATLDGSSLMPCMDGLCRDMAKEYGLQIAFSHQDLPDQMDTDVKLAAFRIVQEALHNTVKHSGASCAEVRITKSGDVITLAVADNGKGLHCANPLSSGGIGMQSMRERARMIGGDLEIETRPVVDGTRVVATIPLAPGDF